MQDGEVPVDGNADQHIRRQIQAEGAEEQKELASHVSRQPLRGDPPSDLQGYHEERDEEVGDAEVRDHERYPALPVPAADEGDEDGEVPDGGYDEEDAVDNDDHQMVVVEAQVLRQDDGAGVVRAVVGVHPPH